MNFDAILSTELPSLKEKQDSQPSPRLKPVVECDSDFEPDPINYSWEGAVAEWDGDGTSKRLMLLAWMESQ